MGELVKYRLHNESLNKDLGIVMFNGKFVFELDKSLTPEQWNAIGFIPLKNNQYSLQSEDLFAYLSSRLPINIRDKSNKEILRYIDDTGLRVASDSFVLKKIA